MKSDPPLLAKAETYARARLQLGMGGVGAFVVLALLALAIGLPQWIFSGAGGSIVADASLLALWVAGLSVLMLPLEWLGGVRLPERFGRRHPELGDWLVAWLKGVLMVVIVASVCGALVVVSGRYLGRIGATGMVGLLAIGLAGTQRWLATLIGTMDPARTELDEVREELRRMGVMAPPIDVLDSQDEGFTGGIAGLPTAERIVLPLRWVGQFDAPTVAMLIARRVAIIDRGLRAMGLGMALAWTLAIFALATTLPGAGVGDVAGFVGTSLWFTVLSFIGLLVLPTPSRAGTFAADAWGLDEDGGNAGRLVNTIEALDRLQDDEPERPDKVETVFHPIPNVASRRAALEQPERKIAPWHLARSAIFLSLVGLSPLGRLVHCNAGRPDLWVFLPSDG